MATARKKGSPANASAATIGCEAELWRMADAPGGSMDVVEYKHVAPGCSTRLHVPHLPGLSGELRVNERATQTVLEQAEALSPAWAA